MTDEQERCAECGRERDAIWGAADGRPDTWARHDCGFTGHGALGCHRFVPPHPTDEQRVCGEPCGWGDVCETRGTCEVVGPHTRHRHDCPPMGRVQAAHAWLSPPQPTDEQQAERRIADAREDYTDAVCAHVLALDTVPAYASRRAIDETWAALVTAIEAPLQAQIARLEADVANAEADESDRFFRSLAGLTGSDSEAAYGAVILAQREEVRALEERLAVVTATSGRTFDGYTTALDRALAAEAERDAARAALRRIAQAGHERGVTYIAHDPPDGDADDVRAFARAALRSESTHEAGAAT